MRVDGCVSGRASQVLVVTVWDMDSRTGVSVLFGQAKVNDEQFVAVATNPH
jgi:hypothetical protein